MEALANAGSVRAGEHHLLLELLQRQGRLDSADLEELRRLRSQYQLSWEEAVVKARRSTAEEVALLYARELGIPLIDLAAEKAPTLDACKGMVPLKFQRDRRLVPVRADQERCWIAAADPTDSTLESELQLLTGRRVHIGVAPVTAINTVLGELYGVQDLMREIVSELDGDDMTANVVDEVTDIDREVEVGPDSSVVRLVNQVIRGALDEGASDIHLEPAVDHYRLRYRVDGILREVTRIARNSATPMLSRLKILSKMDIAEKRLPQDGAIQVIWQERRVDFRVNTVPAIWGEKMVIRVLGRGSAAPALAELGYTERQCHDLTEAVNAPHGLVFVTGPTGSGKSTTLYAALQVINTPGRNLMTVEDPVEFKIPGITQVQTKAAIGLTFASVLRAFLRQDPDVILVGEVRDAETAQICLRAALTGHLVMSTLHTNDSLTTIGRLTDLGLEPFMIGSTLRLVVAQRLVRRLCAACKEAYAPPPEVLSSCGYPAETMLARPRGCDACKQRGYRGRVGIFEVLKVSPPIAEMIRQRAPTADIERVARANDTMFMTEHGLERARAGETSLEEVHRVALPGGE